MKSKLSSQKTSFCQTHKASLLCLYVILIMAIQFGLNAQSFYNINNIQKIEVSFYQSNWDYILDTAKAGKDGYLISKWVKINGVQFDSAGIKFKGNSSYNLNNNKNPFHIELDHVKNQNYQGYKDIKLSNGFKDPSFVREVLAYNIANKYMTSPLANYAQLYINNVYIGLYTNVEAITKTFVNNRFYSSNNSFFFMDNFNCNLKYNGQDSAFYTAYTIKSTTGWKNLIALCDTLNNKPASIESILDLDRTLWMLAFDNLLVNLDSYIGGPAHNYYTYMDNNRRFNPIVWDVNEAFGNFNNAGGGPALSVSQMQVMSPMLHGTDPNWPLISKVLADPKYKRMYYAHYKTMLNENITNNLYVTTAQTMQAVADTAVQSDVYKFYTYAQFLSNINNNVTSGPQTMPGLTVLMNPRASFLQSQTEFTVTSPAISSVSVVSTPSLNTVITFTANITNANPSSVYLGYRYLKSDKFNKLAMFDDGLHNDGSALDNVFGATFTLTAAQIQYYVYAENNNAGKFSPERAEYEFYTLYAVQTATPGQVKINEFLADNQGDVKNEYNMYEDWIELYNSSASPIEVGGIFLTDNFSSPFKFQIPQNTIIQPNGFLIIWADENPSTTTYVHSNFKLAAGGEQLMLSNSSGTVLDSISYGAQQTDKSMARCPDGTGSFTVATFPTFKQSNCAISVEELAGKTNLLKIYPNPGNDYVTVRNSSSEKVILEVFNTLGELIYSSEIRNEQLIQTQNWVPGVYFVRCGMSTKKIIISH